MAGCVVNALPLVAPPGCVVMVIWVGAPAVTVIDDEVAFVSPGALNVSVYVPAVPVTPSPENAAPPLAVVGVVEPVSVAPPAEIAADTTIPSTVSAFPAP